jgi:hypothetical protein
MEEEWQTQMRSFDTLKPIINFELNAACRLGFGPLTRCDIQILGLSLNFLANMEPYRLTATQVVAKIRSGNLTVEQYAQSLLSRVEARDSVVKAWAYLDPAQIIEQARMLDQIPPDQRGPLHGVAIAVKDVIYTKGSPIMVQRQLWHRLTWRKTRYADTA